MSKAADPPGRWAALGVLCLAVVLSLTTWFSATAVTPELVIAWGLGTGQTAWLTNGVQLGFVAGALGASLVNLPDLVRLNRLMAAAAVLAGCANAAILLEPGAGGLIAARFVTGMALAGVYPPAMKMIATWFVRGRGLAMGAVIGALTMGSAAPHLIRALTSGLDWQAVVGATSLASFLAAAIFLLLIREGPFPFARAVFEPRQIGAVFRDRALMLVTLGYLGHMWELYAMWAWLLVFVTAAIDGPPQAASLITFWAIAAGMPGCLLGGVLADRFGRARVTAGLMALSGACALLIGFAFAGPTWLLVGIALVWGISIVGDSAQFSAATTELADRRFVGSILSVQLGAGFLLTVLAVDMMPRIAAALGGWQWAFAPLALGPAIGASAMLLLRRRPEAERRR